MQWPGKHGAVAIEAVAIVMDTSIRLVKKVPV